jgi:hypothetical protein
MKRTVMVLALVVVLALPALAAAAASETQQVRHAISWQRARTWHWQTVAHVRRSSTIRGASGPHSVGYLRWIERRWNSRRVTAYKLAHRPTAYAAGIAHAALWSCIHGLEAGWHQPSYATDSNGVPLYWGGLQMHAGWGYGTSYHASDDPPAVQMLAAENGYKASGYSRTWLMGQWYHPECLVHA